MGEAYVSLANDAISVLESAGLAYKRTRDWCFISRLDC